MPPNSPVGQATMKNGARNEPPVRNDEKVVTSRITKARPTRAESPATTSTATTVPQQRRSSPDRRFDPRLCLLHGSSEARREGRAPYERVPTLRSG